MAPVLVVRLGAGVLLPADEVAAPAAPPLMEPTLALDVPPVVPIAAEVVVPDDDPVEPSAKA